MTAADIALCLLGVDSAVEKNLKDNKAVCIAYGLARMGALGTTIDMGAEARPGDVAADAKKEGEQG